VTGASIVTCPAWRKTRVSGTSPLDSNGTGFSSTTPFPSGLRERVLWPGMVRLVTTVGLAAGPVRSVSTICVATGLRTASSSSGVAPRLRMSR
jgi:hypothetical protein